MLGVRGERKMEDGMEYGGALGLDDDVSAAQAERLLEVVEGIVR